MPAPVQEQLHLLKRHYPHAHYYLDFSNPLELMVAAILSAQVRDEVVNAATPALFRRYKTAKDYAEADIKELIGHIKNVSFAGNKAKNIKAACTILVEKHGGKVPNTMEALTELPGIGRKTANTILINGFDIVEGIPCDTHVIRLSYRLGWTKNTNPDKIEQDLMQLVPKVDWKKVPYLLKDHGRAVCRAPVPQCSQCFLNKTCPKQGVTKKL
ncbi:MAG: endonuclease III [Candidatus Aenigmarchaeota archaeon]|nr:endonuclease III [Candidatus Aenigmarchaeota archaeon]